MNSGLFLSQQRGGPNAPRHAEGILALFESTRRIRATLPSGGEAPPLRGRNIAVLHGRPRPATQAAPLRQAAQLLGARVADIPFAPARSSERHDDNHRFARMLGRLYDAIDCEALPAEVVKAIEDVAGVVVYDGLCRMDHPARAMADLLSICEHPGTVVAPSGIVFVGDAARSPRSVFVEAARELGFEVSAADGSPARSGDVAVDASQGIDWDIRIAGRPIDSARRSENHRCVIQAMLLAGIAGR